MAEPLILNETYLQLLKETVNIGSKLPSDLIATLGRSTIQKSHNNFTQHVIETDDPKLIKLLPNVICVYKDDYDFFYVYMLRNKKIYYMDSEDIKFNEKGNYPYKTFIQKYKTNTLISL
jgi:hypothetical protein